MRKLFILLALLILLPMTLNADSDGVQLHMLPTTLDVNDSTFALGEKADTSAWIRMPADITSSAFVMWATGEDAGDACSVFVDFCEADTTDSFQLWPGVCDLKKNYTSSHWFGGRDGNYTTPELFQYLRMKRLVYVCTGNVLLRAWQNCFIGEPGNFATWSPFDDALTSTTATADTSAWYLIPEKATEIEWAIRVRGDDSGDLCSLYIDFCEADTTDSCQVSWKEGRDVVSIGADKWYDEIDDYGYPEYFQYIRMRRVIATVSTSVTMRSWLVFHLE